MHEIFSSNNVFWFLINSVKTFKIFFIEIDSQYHYQKAKWKIDTSFEKPFIFDKSDAFSVAKATQEIVLSVCFFITLFCSLVTLYHQSTLIVKQL